VPFRAETPFAILHHHLHTPLPPPETRNPGIAPALTAVIKKALAKQPKQRFQNVQELLDALQAAAAAPDYTPAGIRPLEPPTIVDTRTPGPLRKERRRWLWAVVAVPLIILLSLVAFVLFRRSHERQCELHYNRGITYLNQGDCKLALYEFDEVLTTCAGFQDAAAKRTEAKQACNVDDWYDQGREALEVGNWADADEFLGKVYELDPDYRQVVNKLLTARVSYAEQLLAEGNLQTALRVFDMAKVDTSMSGTLPSWGRGIKRAALDLSGGGDEMPLYMCDGNRVTLLGSWRTEDDDTMVQEVIARLKGEAIKAEWFFVDEGGLGKIILNNFDRKGYSPNRVNFGEAARDKKLYGNRRAEMFCELANRIKLEELILPKDQELRDQLSWQKYRGYSSPMKLIDKKKMPHSPDRADTLAMLYSDFPATSEFDDRQEQINKAMSRTMVADDDESQMYQGTGLWNR